MPLFNALRGVPVAEGFKRLFGISAGPGLAALNPEIEAGVDLYRTEFWHLHRGYPWSVDISVAADVANVSGALIENALNTGAPANALVIVTGIIPAVAVELNLVIDNALHSDQTTGGVVRLDTRGSLGTAANRNVAVPPRTNAGARATSTAFGTIMGRLRSGSDGLFIPLNVVLGRFGGFGFTGIAINVGVEATVFGFTRMATQEELAS